MKNQKYKIFIAVVLLLSAIRYPLSVKSQVRPVYDYGANGLAQLLKKLNTTKSVMMIGAHPDDEDSALLAYLARGENARTAYLSLTRGDGGQNIIGSELFESLGVIRTEELLQARRLDGAEQYFTRAFDYGFSKTLAEAKEKWDEKIILCDTVAAIRKFQPLVVISRFSGTPADGHGQHQYSGYISPLAVRTAADETQCRDAGAPWQVLKFYVEQGFRGGDSANLKINTGEYNNLLGRSYAEIAAEGRSQHKTQEQGGLELKGDRFSGLNLIESVAPKIAAEKSIFDGIDTSLTAAPKLFVRNESSISESTKKSLAAAQNSAERALKEYDPNEPQKIVPILVEGEKALNFSFIKLTDLLDNDEIASKRPEIEEFLSEIGFQKFTEFKNAIQLALGIRIDAVTNQETVTPGGEFTTLVKVFYPKNSNVVFKKIKLASSNDWTISTSEELKDNSAFAAYFRENSDNSAFFKARVPVNQKATQPYFLESPRYNSLYVWDDLLSQNLPFQHPLIKGEAIFEIYGVPISFGHAVEYRYADTIRGEIRRDLNVVPKISVAVDQNLLIIPKSEKEQSRRVVLNLTNNSSSSISGAAKIVVPKGWTLAPESAKFDLNKKDEKASINFVITVPAKARAENFALAAQAVTADGEIFSRNLNLIQYPHIQTHRFYTNAKTVAEVFDLKTAPGKVGYIMGSGDEVPDAIRQMGFSVDLLSEKDLSSEDLSKYDTIVVGIRAYQVRADLAANNQRILDYVKNGGNLIVQYQRPDYVASNLEPFPASMTDKQGTTAGTTARVVDENAKVTILEPNSPVFNFPNKITDADFAGWVQERNLYNFVTFDEKYTGLLESHDAGEQENKGGMVYAKIGKGNYVYTSYSFFRQLPAGVPGAYRLFANLLSLK